MLDDVRVAIAVDDRGGIRRRVDDHGLMGATAGRERQAGEQYGNNRTHDYLPHGYLKEKTSVATGSFYGLAGNHCGTKAL